MAKRTIVILTDDIDGQESEHVTAQSFKLPNVVVDEDGAIDFVVERFSFDSTDENAATFVRDIQKAVAKYRRKENVIVKVVGDGSGNSSGEYSEAMDKRDFAKANNLKVSERGRISADVDAAYRKAIADGTWVAFQNAPKSDADNGTDENASE